MLQTRGVVITPDDLSLTDWPVRAKRAGLNTIGIHHQHSPSAVRQFMAAEAGVVFLQKCRAEHLQVEYELHAMRELLPRTLFEKHPEMYRMNEKGDRTPDMNLCVHSRAALTEVAENAVELAQGLPSTTGRYFFWTDDALPGCFCPKCKSLSESHKALIVENEMIATLRKWNPKAQLAHLAYARTLEPPMRIKPASGIFLEFAPLGSFKDPFHRRPDENARVFEFLDKNLAVFGTEGAQALEYWLDVSALSAWQKPAKKLDLDTEALESELHEYTRRGIRHVTSFAVFIDAEYVARYGDQPLAEYGRVLRHPNP
jgi:hypothetical protein